MSVDSTDFVFGSEVLDAPANSDIRALLSDVQGDVLIGFPKKAEDFFIFRIVNVKAFRAGLRMLLPRISTSETVRFSRAANREWSRTHHGTADWPFLHQELINIGFSKEGLQALGIDTEAAFKTDQAFVKGMNARRDILNDKADLCLEQYRDPSKIHGVILIAGESKLSVAGVLFVVKRIFGDSVVEVITEHGQTRPGDQDGHEHFGFEDGVSIPAVHNFHKKRPGQGLIERDVLLLGTPSLPPSSDRNTKLRNNGTFLCFRHLSQDVGAFEAFIRAHADSIPDADLTKWFHVVESNPVNRQKQKQSLFGARLVGRWQSGVPIIDANGNPNKDGVDFKAQKAIVDNKEINNFFDFGKVGTHEFDTEGVVCPFVAHIRKTNPRGDVTKVFDKPFEVGVAPHLLMRRGMQFGPEFKDQPLADRGLLFACYQSSLEEGFEFVQRSWANNVSFVKSDIGHDPIIGQAPTVTDLAFNDVSTRPGSTKLKPLTQFVKHRGGEYFFVPSMTALREVLAKDPEDKIPAKQDQKNKPTAQEVLNDQDGAKPKPQA